MDEVIARPMRRLLLLGAIALAAGACGGAGGEIVDPPIDKPAVDPYATLLIENVTTAAAGAQHTNYEINLFFPSAPPGDTPLSLQGGAGPGEKMCTGLGGFVGLRTMQVVGIGDTLQLVGLTPQAVRDSAARGLVTWTGMVRLATPVFDPLVSLADTTRGHTPQRPVMWRWTINDVGTTLVEDSTTACTYQ